MFNLRRIGIAAVLLVSMASASLAQDKRASFGALESTTPAAAKEKLAAWLKEVGKSDAAALQKLDAIWKDDTRTLLDRTADSLALGDATAAGLMKEARDANVPAPVVVPQVFKNTKTSAFYRANLGLIYARALINRRVYEEALDTLKLFGADQTVDPASYLFHRAVCEHAMRQKADANKSITRLLEEGSSISPDRYKTVATLMLLDMHTWKEKDLGDIAGKMSNIERRLDIARGGQETHRQQREVLNRLDEIIKKLENQNKNKKKDPGDGKPGDGKPGDQPGDQCPDGGSKPGSGGPAQGTQTNGPASESSLPQGQSTGNLDQKKFAKLVSEFGRLPPAEQKRALQELTQGMPPRHREAIENYFRNLTNPAATNRK